MWHVVLDSNAVILDLRPAEDGWRRLCAAARAGRVSVGIPEIVVDELVAHRTNRHQPDVADAITALAAWRDGRAERLVDKLLGGGAGFELLPYPEVTHRAVAARALARRRPFDRLGHDGYRDTLVWETVLALARSRPGAHVVFVSRNSKDFAAEVSPGAPLHPQLRDDVATLGAGASIELVHDLGRLAARLGGAT
jgi:predicted nucleic acid-binding protein